MVVNGTRALGNNVDAFKNEVAKMSGVKSGCVQWIPARGQFIQE